MVHCIHSFNGLFFRTTWLSWHQKGKPFWILLEQEMMGWQWHQLDHMQIICTSLQAHNHTSTWNLLDENLKPWSQVPHSYMTVLQQSGNGTRLYHDSAHTNIVWEPFRTIRVMSLFDCHSVFVIMTSLMNLLECIYLYVVWHACLYWHQSEWVSSFLTAHQDIIFYSVLW